MDSAESPGSPKDLTEVTDDRKMRGEISDPGNLQRGTGLKINVEKSRSENNNGGSDGAEISAEIDKEVEEGELVESWEDATPGKGSRNPNLKYDQVKILTPSRFPALLEVDEKGNGVNQVEYEEIISVEEEIVIEETEEEVSKEEN
ncbi:hypothetical protein HID58_067509 [Brassica napus]|uniref:Uncharacterized protein n=1 Tax=Brassica napus TaxID=3708 RepID=A0ABQ7ZIR1_BRANA|nr:hypothetical protein HID58_067509 [Brassica napus]